MAFLQDGRPELGCHEVHRLGPLSKPSGACPRSLGAAVARAWVARLQFRLGRCRATLACLWRVRLRLAHFAPRWGFIRRLRHEEVRRGKVGDREPALFQHQPDERQPVHAGAMAVAAMDDEPAIVGIVRVHNERRAIRAGFGVTVLIGTPAMDFDAVYDMPGQHAGFSGTECGGDPEPSAVVPRPPPQVEHLAGVRIDEFAGVGVWVDLSVAAVEQAGSIRLAGAGTRRDGEQIARVAIDHARLWRGCVCCPTWEDRTVATCQCTTGRVADQVLPLAPRCALSKLRWLRPASGNCWRAMVAGVGWRRGTSGTADARNRRTHHPLWRHGRLPPRVAACLCHSPESRRRCCAGCRV